MDNIVGPILAVAGTILLLLLRELFLSVGKKKKSYGAVDHQLDAPGFGVETDNSLYSDQIMEFDGPTQQATTIAVDEFLAELRARAQEQSTSRIKDGATTDFGRPQSNRNETAEDLW